MIRSEVSCGGTTDGRNNYFTSGKAIEDYWTTIGRFDHAFSEKDRMFVRVHRDFDACKATLDGERPRRWFAFTTQAARSLYAARFAPGDALVFGCESSGLPDSVLARFSPDARLRIPMRPGVRSLNLSNAVAVAVYEAWRQLRFIGSES